MDDGFPPIDHVEAEPVLDTAPHDLDAEQALLGALLYENSLLDQIEWITPDDFYDPVHVRIFEHAKTRIERGNRADAVTVFNEMREDEGLLSLGGATYLAVLVESAADIAAAPEYGKIVQDLSRRRNLAAFGSDIEHAARSGEESGVEIIERAERGLAVLSDTESRTNIVSLGSALRSALNQPIHYAETDLTEFQDNRILAPGLIILAGRSSMGKSALLLYACYSAASLGQSCLILTNEMPEEQIALRIAATMTGIPYVSAINGWISEEQKIQLDQAVDEVDRLPLKIVDVAGESISAMRSIIRRWKRAEVKAGRKIGLVGLDYLQNIPGQGNSLYEKTSNIAGDLQTMQRNLDICLAVGCQIGRANEKEKDKRPAIHNLRDSGKIEEVADKILLVYRDAYYAEREPVQDDVAAEIRRKERALSKVVEIDLAKNRQGPLKKFELIADMSLNKFEDMR